jgi:putative addiction module component (TIGR02574 family)
MNDNSIKSIKIDLIEKIIHTSDESILDEIKLLFEVKDVTLSEPQKNELDRRTALLKNGNQKTFSWEETKNRARASKK